MESLSQLRWACDVCHSIAAKSMRRYGTTISGRFGPLFPPWTWKSWPGQVIATEGTIPPVQGWRGAFPPSGSQPVRRFATALTTPKPVRRRLAKGTEGAGRGYRGAHSGGSDWGARGPRRGAHRRRVTLPARSHAIVCSPSTSVLCRPSPRTPGLAWPAGTVSCRDPARHALV